MSITQSVARRLARTGNRWRVAFRAFFSRGDFTTLIITCGLLVVPVISMTEALAFSQDLSTQSGGWAVSLQQIVPVAIVSVLIGYVLARSHWSELTALIFSAIYSVGTVLAVQYVAAPGNLLERVYAVLVRLAQAFQLGVSTGSGFDPFVLVMFLSILVWFLGHNTAWHTFRLDRVWRAVLPPGIVLVLNSIYNTQTETHIDAYLIVYAFLAMLLVVRSHVEAREYDWYANRIVFRGNVRRWFLRFGAAIAALLMAVAWALPTGSAEENARRFQEFLNQDALMRVLELMNRLFGSLEGQTAPSSDYYGGDKLTLGGAIQLGEQIVMAVGAPQGAKLYWKSRSFDTYQNNEWTNSPHQKLTNEGSSLVLVAPPVEPNTRRLIEQRFLMVIPSSRLIYSAPQASTIRLPANVELNYVEPGTGALDVVAIRPLEPLERGDQYSVVSSVSAASEDMLRRASTAYPAWVTASYLQLPPTITARTRDLALQIVAGAGASTPYDRARALERWLRDNIRYAEIIPTPPRDRELVDWVLFDQREAYCTYYASAMIVMLRSMGIPARMAAGFAQGFWEPASSAYIVRERDAHTWVEVYFPGAGWVEFEPTASRETFPRLDPALVAGLPTPTPSPTITPTFTPPAEPTQNDNGQMDAPTLSPTPQSVFTVTPTPPPLLSSPTPTPTETPPAPPRFLEVPPEVQGFLGNLLALAGVIAAFSFVGVGTLWWVEYRGLDRLSPLGRAYARVGIYAKWLGIAFKRGSTPLERGRQVAREITDEGRSVIDITDAYIGERYGPPGETSLEAEESVNAAWRRSRRALLRRRFGRKK